MQILVTGAAGFLGRNLIPTLVDLGHSVEAVDSLNSDLYPSEIKRANFDTFKSYSQIHTWILDLSKENLPESALNCDVIINLAALPGQQKSWNMGRNYMESNYLVVDSLINQFIAHDKFPRWIQASTSSVYGLNSEKSELDPCDPCNPYGVTKLAAENLLKSYAKYFNFKVTILRYFSIYGPHQRPDMGIYKFLTAISNQKRIQVYGDGSQTRDLTFVADAVDATTSAIQAKLNTFEIFNISGGKIYSVNEIIDVCAEIIGKKPILEYVKTPIGDQQSTKAIGNKARKELNFEGKVDIYQGIYLQWEKFKDGKF